MPIEELRPLKQAFLDEYGHFADKRIKNIDKSARFIVDDRETQPSFGADGPFGWFCQMFADVEGPSEIFLTIRGPIPLNDSIRAWIDRNGKVSFRDTLTIAFTPKNVDELVSLAEAFRAIVARGATYDTASHKYVCPRMAACLERLHSLLKRHWSEC